MKKVLLTIAIVLLLATTAIAQDWEESSVSETEFNCELVKKLLEDHGDEPYARVNGEVQTFTEFHTNAVPACDSAGNSSPSGETLFKVSTSGAVNLRDCGNTSCNLVGKTAADGILEVVAGDGEWYEIKYDGGTAFIAGWLTTRLPDALIETGETHYILETGCVVVPDSKRSSDLDITIIITGDNKDDVVVDLYRPDNDTPLKVQGQLDKTFIDTGDSYIHQYYYWNTWWPTGIYTIVVEMDRNVYKIAWNVVDRDDYNVFVNCD